MKYKVAAEVGDAEEIEAFKLYEKTNIESRGEENYRLFAKKAKKSLKLMTKRNVQLLGSKGMP